MERSSASPRSPREAEAEIESSSRWKPSSGFPVLIWDTVELPSCIVDAAKLSRDNPCKNYEIQANVACDLNLSQVEFGYQSQSVNPLEERSRGKSRRYPTVTAEKPQEPGVSIWE